MMTPRSRTMFARRTFLAVLTTSLIFLGPTFAGAAPGSLDPTFDTDGILTTGIGTADTDDRLESLVIQPDGKIVVGGYSYIGPGAAGGVQFSLARYNPDGSLDTSFDTDGKQTTGIAPGGNFDGITALALQLDGKIVAGGFSDMGPTVGAGGYQFSLARYNTNGSLDDSFDTDGKLMTAIGPGDNGDFIAGLVIQSDGKIVAGGRSDMGGAGGGGDQFSLARYNTNGSLDGSFGVGGKQTTGIAPGDNYDFGNALAIQSDDKIVVGGFSDMGVGTGGAQFSIARYNANGSLDGSFGTGGKQTTGIAPVDGGDSIYALAIQSDGKIVAGGRSYMGVAVGGPQFSLARYDTTGALDTSFGTGGKQTTGVAPVDGDDVINELSIQPDDKIVVGGYSYMGGAGTGGGQFSLARYTTTGLLDTSFDIDGTLTTAIAPGDNDDVIRGLAIQPDGKIVAAGGSIMATGAGGLQFSLARYNGLIPDTTISAGPTEGFIIVDNTPTFEFKSLPAGAAFQCSVNGGAFTACSSPHTTAVLADGIHSFAVRATDSVGDPDPTPARRGFAVVVPKPATPPADSNINRIKKKIKAKKLKKFTGTATNATKVEIALLKLSPGVKAAATKGKKKRSCLWLKSSKVNFKPVKPNKLGICDKHVWLKATGTAKWLFKLKKKLPKGKYVLYSRAIGADGKAETSFSAADKNRVTFKII